MAKPTFEDAMKRLEAIAQELEGGNLTLDEAFKKFQEGVKLSKLCANKLEETEKKVSILLKDEQGNVLEKPFSPESNESA